VVKQEFTGKKPLDVGDFGNTDYVKYTMSFLFDTISIPFIEPVDVNHTRKKKSHHGSFKESPQSDCCGRGD
tara:strand:- start:563 stop:775 length:213 start_codon:yes stop_codon:yes gene_type:complete